MVSLWCRRHDKVWWVTWTLHQDEVQVLAKGTAIVFLAGQFPFQCLSSLRCINCMGNLITCSGVTCNDEPSTPKGVQWLNSPYNINTFPSRKGHDMKEKYKLKDIVWSKTKFPKTKIMRNMSETVQRIDVFILKVKRSTLPSDLNTNSFRHPLIVSCNCSSEDLVNGLAVTFFFLLIGHSWRISSSWQGNWKELQLCAPFSASADF